MVLDPLGYEVWYSRTNDGEWLVAVYAIEADGARRIVRSERLGPFDDKRDCVKVAWLALSIDWAGSLP